MSDTLAFIGRMIRHPRRIGAIAPSSSVLGAAMAAGIGPQTPGVVEFGGGTGQLTRAVLRTGLPPDRLVVAELDPVLAARLQHDLPGIAVRNVGAQAITAEGLPSVSHIISGLPILNFPYELQMAIMENAFRLLAPGGMVVQFTYGPKVPLRARVVEELGLTTRRRKWVAWNLPPATVYEITKPQAAD
jgi:phosphatidylethanolamine/phosphatidyl-N-methylethanolamine N-methyltransferase